MPSLHIDVIELDAALEAIGRKYFDLPKTSRLRVITADGRKYIEQAVAVYDMIIIDAFSDADIPRTLSTLEAMQHIRHHLVPNGLLAVNLIASYYGQHTQALRQYYAAFTEVFERVQLFAADRSLPLLMPQNFVLIGSKNSRLQLDPFVRYGALQPPRFEPEDILHDEL